jgi:DNA-binding Lrp family transcriptional regulator
VTGRYDYLIKVNLRDVEELQEFLVEKLTKIEFINKVETFIAISSIPSSRFIVSNNNE